MTRIFVAIATIGRPETVARVVEWLGRQSRPADGIVVSAVSDKDVEGLERVAPQIETIFGQAGLCRQRNRALAHVAGRADILVFFDDDFVPHRDYLGAIETRFDSDPDLAGATGMLIADGIHGEAITFDEAVQLAKGYAAGAERRERPIEALYGCNMTVRLSACRDMEFDERLPLYGWLEDVDFTHRLAKRGSLVKSDAFVGVHMGVKGGRTSGRRLGYSQIANPVYLLRKGSIPRHLAYRLMRQNLLSNLVRSIRPEPRIDRVGRLKGNLLALLDVARGRIDPEKVMKL